MENRQYKTLPSVVLLNSEGDILKAFKKEEMFIIIDEHKEIIDTLTKKQLFDFTRGGITLTNSKGVVFNYTKQPGTMKPDLKMLDEFIGIDTDKYSY